MSNVFPSVYVVALMIPNPAIENHYSTLDSLLDGADNVTLRDRYKLMQAEISPEFSPFWKAALLWEAEP
jgi:hypothetical protein